MEGEIISTQGEIRPMQAVDHPQAKAGEEEIRDGSKEEQVEVWSQLEVGDTYQRQLDQLRQLKV